VVSAAKPDELPESFRIWFRAGTSHGRLLSALREMVGVDEVKVADPTLRRLCLPS
jgi:hypothetical protein